MKLFLIIIFSAISLSGCCIFEYKCSMTPVWQIEKLAEVPATSEGDSAIPTLPTIGNPVHDFVLNLLANSGAVDAAKVLTIAVAGDPASITAWQGNAAYKVTVTKRFFVIETKGQANANK